MLVSEAARPGVNFINVLREAFMLTDPESARKTVKLSVFFVLLESERAKAACRTLMKLNPGVNFINALHKAFTNVDHKSAKMTVKSSVILRFWDLRA
jgi:hypothetical protein